MAAILGIVYADIELPPRDDPFGSEPEDDKEKYEVLVVNGKPVVVRK